MPGTVCARSTLSSRVRCADPQQGELQLLVVRHTASADRIQDAVTVDTCTQRSSGAHWPQRRWQALAVCRLRTAEASSSRRRWLGLLQLQAMA